MLGLLVKLLTAMFAQFGYKNVSVTVTSKGSGIVQELHVTADTDAIDRYGVVHRLDWGKSYPYPDFLEELNTPEKVADEARAIWVGLSRNFADSFISNWRDQ